MKKYIDSFDSFTAKHAWEDFKLSRKYDSNKKYIIEFDDDCLLYFIYEEV